MSTTGPILAWMAPLQDPWRNLQFGLRREQMWRDQLYKQKLAYPPVDSVRPSSPPRLEGWRVPGVPGRTADTALGRLAVTQAYELSHELHASRPGTSSAGMPLPAAGMPRPRSQIRSHPRPLDGVIVLRVSRSRGLEPHETLMADPQTPTLDLLTRSGPAYRHRTAPAGRRQRAPRLAARCARGTGTATRRSRRAPRRAG